MIHRYKSVSIVYGGNGKKYANTLSKKIDKISNEERYPIQAKIINEKILTCELLNSVMDLFKQCDFCVAFLTKDDSCLTEHGNKMRLRQNVVFEIGMAMIQMGRERCILLSDFDYKAPDFDLPTDMNGLEILQFDVNNLENLLDDVINKLLELSQYSIFSETKLYDIPKYDNLLTRNEYFIDYENLFSDRPLSLALEGKDFFNDTLMHWLHECESLPHYDEKCIFLFERIGFIPAFSLGNIPVTINFLDNFERTIQHYSLQDKKYYNNSDLLDFVNNLIHCVFEYIRIQIDNINNTTAVREHKLLLTRLLSNSPNKNININPLISTIYYNYLGLIYLRIYRREHNERDLGNANSCFLKALNYTNAIDSSMRIWAGFINYNLARVSCECNDLAASEHYFTMAIMIRSKWLNENKYNITVRNALSFEYFIARINQIDMWRRFNLKTPDEIRLEYSYVKKELDQYSDIDNKLDKLISIRQMLDERIQRD